MAEKRNIYLDTNYNSCWSLLDDVSTEELKGEIPLLTKKKFEQNKTIQRLHNELEVTRAKLRTVSEVLDRRDKAQLIKEFKLSDEHRSLIKEIYWEIENPYNSLNIEDVIRILGWQKPNDEPSDEQVEEAAKLLKEIPMALRELFKGIEKG